MENTLIFWASPVAERYQLPLMMIVGSVQTDRSLNLVFHSTLPQSSLCRQKHDLAFFFFGPQRLYGVLLSRIIAILDMIVFAYCI